MDHGEQCVMMIGMSPMLQLCAINLGSKELDRAHHRHIMVKEWELYYLTISCVEDEKQISCNVLIGELELMTALMLKMLESYVRV